MTDWLGKLNGRVGVGIIFAVSFVFFMLVTFPYEILKESISNGLSRVTGLSITMVDFGVKLPIGMQASGLSVSSQGQQTKTVKLNQLSARINPLYILAGKLAVKVYFENPDQSTMDVFTVIPLSGVFGSGNIVPSRVEVDAQNFRVDELAAFALSAAASGNDVNPLLGPILQAVGFSGKLDGAIGLAIDASTPQQSTGSIKIKVKDAILKLSDPSLGLPDQRFSRAGVQAALNNGVLVIEKGSGFESDELTLSAGGSVAVKSSLAATQLQLEILVKLQKSLAEKFGFLLDAFSGGAAKNGELRLQVKGPLSQPSTQPI